jgi:hypothetical protein
MDLRIDSHLFLITQIKVLLRVDNSMEARGGVVVKALRYKTGRSRVRVPMLPLEFFSDIVLPVALWPWS